MPWLAGYQIPESGLPVRRRETGMTIPKNVLTNTSTRLTMIGIYLGI